MHAPERQIKQLLLFVHPAYLPSTINHLVVVGSLTAVSNDLSSSDHLSDGEESEDLSSEDTDESGVGFVAGTDRLNSLLVERAHGAGLGEGLEGRLEGSQVTMS